MIQPAVLWWLLLLLCFVIWSMSTTYGQYSSSNRLLEDDYRSSNSIDTLNAIMKIKFEYSHIGEQVGKYMRNLEKSMSVISATKCLNLFSSWSKFSHTYYYQQWVCWTEIPKTIMSLIAFLFYIYRYDIITVFIIVIQDIYRNILALLLSVQFGL